MAENYAHESHFNFVGGINQAAGKLVRVNDEVDFIQNGELEQIGPIHKVRGYSQRGADVSTDHNILGAVGAIKSDGTMKQILVADETGNSDAFTYNSISDVWTQHALSLTSGSKAELEQFLDGFFMVNFTEATRFNDFTQWYTTTNVTNAPKAKYIKLYLSRLYLGYVVDGASTYPSRVIYSELPTGTPYSLTWNNTDNYFDVDPEDGDVIKALSVNANRLLVFKENTLHRYDTNTRYKVPGCPGTVSQRSVREIQGWTMYLHSSGIWGYDGTTSQLLSRKIKDIIDGISTRDFTNACATVRGDHYYLYVGDINNTKTGLTITKCLIDMDIAKNAFTIRSLEKEPQMFFDYRDDRSNVTYDSATITYDDANTTYNGLVSSEQRIFFGATDGAVYQFDTGNTFDGTDISFIVETQDYYLGYPAINKLFQKIIMFVDSRKSVQVQYKLDEDNWKSLGKVTKTQSELIFPSGSRGKRIKLRVSESSSGDRFAFEGFDVYFTAEGLN